MKVTFDHFEQLNKHTQTFYFIKPAELDYIAGQYVQLSLLHKPVDDRGSKRWFTLSSSPSEPFISITTKFANPSSSFKARLKKLKNGDEVNMVSPMGDFVLPKDETIPLVYVVGGIGVTPVRSMIKWLTDNHEHRQIQLIYAANQEEDLVFKDLFTGYGLEFNPIISQRTNGWHGLTGQLNTERILDLIKNLKAGPLIYVSGPEPMVEVFVEGLTKKIDNRQLVTDYFPGYNSI